MLGALRKKKSSNNKKIGVNLNTDYGLDFILFYTKVYGVKNSFSDISETHLNKWQEVADLLADILQVPAALIMKAENEFMEVFISSRSAGNPYHPGDKEHWSGLYCETVIKSQKKLVVSDAVKDEKWCGNPDIKLGMVAYLGLPINFPDHQPFGTICVLDIKENKFSAQHERLLAQLRNIIEADLALIQSNNELRLAKNAAEETFHAKSRFLANMNHEICTTMNGVIGMVDLLLESSLDQYQWEYGFIAKSSAMQHLRLLNDILDLSKIEAKKVALERKDFYLKPVIDRANSLLKAAVARKGLKMTHTVDADVPRLLVGDEMCLQQVLVNLLGNAVKFTPQGSVDMRVCLKEEGEHTVKLRFEIKDTGIGIAPDKVREIFEPFTQANKSISQKYYATGLGLTICKELVNLMGGEIGIESEVGKGSLFWFTATFASANDESAEPEPWHSEPSWSDHPKKLSVNILVVGDDPISNILFEKILSKWGCHMDLAKSGEDAVQILSSRDYSLVLMDCRLPEMTVHQVVEIIRDPSSAALNHHIPIVAVIVNSKLEDREAWLRIGINDWVMKPIDQNQLFNTIKKWVKNK